MMVTFSVDFRNFLDQAGDQSVRSHIKPIHFRVVTFCVVNMLHETAPEVNINELESPASAEDGDSFWEVVDQSFGERESDATLCAEV